MRIYKITKISFHLYISYYIYKGQSMHDCLLRFSAQARRKVKAILFTSYSCYLTIFFRSVDVRGLRMYGTVLSLYALLVICRSYQGMQWFSRAIT
jgi:hypothetical protein